MSACRKHRAGHDTRFVLYADLTTQQLMDQGRKDIVDTEQGLIRSNKIVADTIQVATATAETLDAQTEQLERTLDNLDRIEFSLKHAKRVIRDITRGMATDKCVSLLPRDASMDRRRRHSARCAPSLCIPSALDVPFDSDI